ncbi:MAG: hypothetical protein ABIZ91_14245, partial [Gemmatimonadaceae bacterium]
AGAAVGGTGVLEAPASEPRSESRGEPQGEPQGRAPLRGDTTPSSAPGRPPASARQDTAAPGRPPASARQNSSAPNVVSALDVNALTACWDDILAAVRRERPLVGSMLSHAVPTAVSASGLVSLQIEDLGAFESLASKTKELTAALAVHVKGLTRVQLLPPESAGDDSGPRRMTAESIKSETIVALRRRDPTLAAAIDELDLDLIG